MVEITEKTYSIGEVAEMFNLTVPTLRYYDKENLIPNLKRMVLDSLLKIISKPFK